MPKYIRPVDYPVSDGGSFTDHVDRGSANPGTDYATPIGTPVRAPAGGLISVVDNDAGGAGGRMIGLDTYDGDGFDFLHLDRLAVVEGQYVNQGDVIAYSGNTGTATTGPHLHMSFRRRQGSHFMNAGNEDFEAALLLLAAIGVAPISTIFQEDDMAINDGGYIAEKKGDEFVRGAIFGPGVPGGVYVVDIRKGATLPPGVHSGKIEDLQAMGNLAGVRVFSPQDGNGKRVGAPIKYVGTAEFDATVKLAQLIYGS